MAGWLTVLKFTVKQIKMFPYDIHYEKYNGNHMWSMWPYSQMIYSKKNQCKAYVHMAFGLTSPGLLYFVVIVSPVIGNDFH